MASFRSLLLFITFIGMTLFVEETVAPFPNDDPRAFLNVFIIPWWIYTPCNTRKAIHQMATGTPLPPDGCQKWRPRSLFSRNSRRNNVPRRPPVKRQQPPSQYHQSILTPQQQQQQQHFYPQHLQHPQF